MYKVLQDFSGNPTGYGEVKTFIAGETVELSDHLAEVALANNFVKAFEPEETKVIEVETKEEPVKKKGKNA